MSCVSLDEAVPQLRTRDVAALQRQRRVVVVVDLVESVRLLIEDETGVVHRWCAFVDCVQSVLLPPLNGRLVKSLGDGLLLDFADVGAAVSIAIDMHEAIVHINQQHPSSVTMALRIGVHIAEVFVDSLDIYGAGVNLAARLGSLARPQETIVSAEVRDALLDSMHVDVEDLGHCYLKHMLQPVRAFRVHPSGTAAQHRWPEAAGHQAVMAVIPFTATTGEPPAPHIGDVLAETMISALTAVQGLQLISRLSTSQLRDSADPIGDARRLLNAHYVLSGQYTLLGGRVLAHCSLADTAKALVVWHGAHEGPVDELVGLVAGFMPHLADQVRQAVVLHQVKRARALPMSSLESFALFISGISLMHRLARKDFTKARLLFEELAYRLPRNATPKAMLAKWHLMRQLQGWCHHPRNDVHMAHAFALRALEQDPDHAFALATEAFVRAHMEGDLEHARDGCCRALELDHQDSQCWRMAASVNCYLGNGLDAEKCAERALSLTPLDPSRFVYELVLGAAKLASGKYDEALDWAQISMRHNALHVPTHRLRILALALAGRDDEAHEAARGLLSLFPKFRVADFESSYPGRDQSHASSYFHALRRAGLPG